MFLGLPSEFWAALLGAIVGSLGTIAGVVLQHHLANRSQKKIDEDRKVVLKRMLDGEQIWRKLDTLSQVIGADKENTKRLLFELGARGSEGTNEVWALISRAPLPMQDDDEG